MAVTLGDGVLKNQSSELSCYRAGRRRHTVRQTAWRVDVNTTGAVSLGPCYMNHPQGKDQESSKARMKSVISDKGDWLHPFWCFR